MVLSDGSGLSDVTDFEYVCCLVPSVTPLCPSPQHGAWPGSPRVPFQTACREESAVVWTIDDEASWTPGGARGPSDWEEAPWQTHNMLEGLDI